MRNLLMQMLYYANINSSRWL